MRIEWSTSAVSDLKAISGYIEQDRNLEIANRITRTIYDRGTKLADDAKSWASKDVSRTHVSCWFRAFPTLWFTEFSRSESGFSILCMGHGDGRKGEVTPIQAITMFCGDLIVQP